LCTQLFNEGCDAIVVACNTATAQAIAQIRNTLDIPIIGVEPGIKPAAMQTQNGIVGVLATEGTLRSDKFNALLATLPHDCQFIKQSGAGLVALIEAGKSDSPETLDLLAHHLVAIQDAGADTLVLGCTHYPFLRKAIRKLLGESINLIDTSEAVVRQLRRQLEQQDPAAQVEQTFTLTFISSKDEMSLLNMANELMTSDMTSHRIEAKSLSSIR
jgi:glutamate racemase